MSLYNKIFVTSVNKALNLAKHNGKLNLEKLAIFNLFNYYLDFTTDKEEFEEENKALKIAIEDLKYKYSEICKYKEFVPTLRHTFTDSNTAPTVSGTTILLGTDEEIFFTVEDFTTNFDDGQNDQPGTVIIYLNGLAGTFTLNGTVVTNTITLPIEDVVTLKYTRPDDDAFSTVIPFRISDDYSLPAYSTIANVTISGTAIGNQPATLGDNTITVDNRVTTTLTLAMFTSELTPPYNDPESDLIDAIRIDEISTANIGQFQLNGTPITEGAIITREDLSAGLFTHVAANIDAISSDNFSFSARDEGSGIWVN